MSSEDDCAQRCEVRRDQVDEAAAEWAVRLARGALNAVEQRRLSIWLAECSEHRRVLEEALSVWERLDDLAAREVVPAPPTLRPGRSSLTAMAMAACLAMAVWISAALWMGDLSDAVAALGADHHTGAGEWREVALPDGSLLRLGPRTALSLRWSDDVRGVDLARGQVMVSAAPRAGAETRPFVVYSAEGRARALGTRYAVSRDGGEVDVVVLEHEVEVSAGPDDRRVVVAPGQAVRYGGQGPAPVRAVDAGLETAWADRRLVFDRTPLAKAARELEKLRGGRVVVADAVLASRVVSGVFDAADPDGALSVIAEVLGARVVRGPLVAVLY